jgi:DtxR family Mn-dependent transcriptional regulator
MNEIHIFCRLNISEMPKEQVEEYIEAIFDIAGRDGTAKTMEVAKRLNKALASVTEVFQSMAQNGLVQYEPYKGVTLTEKGAEAALKIKRKHRLLEVFLTDILHIDPEKVHGEACRMEHCISDEVGDAICEMLNAPARCPNGKPIYPCEKEIETCNECKEVVKMSELAQRKILPITDLKPCQKGIIAFLRGGRRMIQRLSDLGLTPGTEVTLLRKTPLCGPIELSVRRTSLAVGRDIADNIFVEAAGGGMPVSPSRTPSQSPKKDACRHSLRGDVCHILGRGCVPLIEYGDVTMFYHTHASK